VMVWVWTSLIFLFVLLLGIREDVKEIGDQVSMLQADFISEISEKYGDSHGEE
jgi:hypothetical protein